MPRQQLLIVLLHIATLLYFAVADNPGVCFQDDGLYRSTSAGTFLITCGKRAGRGVVGTPETQPTFAACIDACAADPQCKSVDYNVDTLLCSHISGSFIPMLSAPSNPTIHNARLAVPPTPPSGQQIPIGGGSGSGSGSGTGTGTGGTAGAGDAGTGTGGTGGTGGAGTGTGGTGGAGGAGAGTGTGASTSSGSDIGAGTPSGTGNNTALVMTTNPQCGPDDGKAYIASDGTYFKIQCGKHASPLTILKTGASTGLADCMNQCASMGGCNSIKITSRPQATSTEPYNQCVLYGEGNPAVDVCPPNIHDFAYAIDPPAIDDDEFPNYLCSTVCPYSDGMTYTTPYGESFKMDCGKRHGTEALATATANNLKECMDICGGYVACHSVDFQYRTKKCYLGAHHGNPSIMATGFDSAHSIGCAGACGGAGCCSGSGGGGGGAVASSPPVPIGPPAADVSCNNQGFEYAIYNCVNAAGAPITVSGGAWPVDPTIFKTRTPQTTGKTTSFGLTDTNTIYGYTPTDPEHVVVDHRGYLFAQQDGVYTFSNPAADDIVLLWLGSLAYSGWTRSNAVLEQQWSGSQQPKTFTATLTKGKYYPMRIFFANGGGPGYFKFRLTAPDGTVILGDGAVATTPFLVQFSCDGTTAPKFPAWGSET